MTCHEITQAIEAIFQDEMEKRADSAACFDSILSDVRIPSSEIELTRYQHAA